MDFLRHSADIRALFVLSIQSIVIIVFWGMLEAPLLLAIPLVSFLAFISCIIKHNHMHCSTFINHHLNNALGIWLALLTGTSSVGIVQAHNVRHHGALNSEHDFVRTTLVQSTSPLMNLLMFPFVSIVTMFQERENDLSYWWKRDKARFKQLLIEMSCIWLLLISGLLIATYSTITLLLIPWLIAQVLLVAVNFLQHDQCDTDSELHHSRNVTGLLLNWLFFNNGFHTAHHVNPGLHWSQLPEYHYQNIEPFIPCTQSYNSLTSLLCSNYIKPIIEDIPHD